MTGEEKRAEWRRLYAANRDRVLANQRARGKDPRVKAVRAASRKRWNAANKDRVREANKAYRAAHPKPKKERKLKTEAEKRETRRKQRHRYVRLPHVRARLNAKTRLKWQLVRSNIIELLGGKCMGPQHSGTWDERVLQIDHIHGDGYRLKGAKARYDEQRRSLANGDVAQRYQLLCANCHVLKTMSNGEHKERRVEVEMPLPLFAWKN